MTGGRRLPGSLSDGLSLFSRYSFACLIRFTLSSLFRTCSGTIARNEEQKRIADRRNMVVVDGTG